ncbi:MAG: RagB/SusD family nutrient uptake outer membrane protein [Muribaculaceae bacterium]|jgi:hypothetical protein|nr:RagB/SusD family nutrient uptake outer membrane protein [Muribaculaceae bacterium]
MKRYISALLLSASLVGFTGCDDFLDEMPESSIIPENFFSTADQLAAYSIALYGNFPVHDQYTYSLGTFIIDNGTDNQVGMSASSQWSPGLWQTPSGSGWSFTFIRNCNYFLQNVLPKYEAGQISGNATEVKQYIGEMYFLRAYAYWNQYSAYGDFPIITEALPDDKEVLMAQTLRRPRNEVARFILDDLAKAIDLLPVNATGGKQRINKACAQLLRSRVALFEGTWLKYHKGTALVPGGPGWPGDPSMISGFNIDQEITYFLSEAMASAQPVGDAIVSNLAVNTDTPEGYSDANTCINPYYGMFTEANLDAYDEVLMYKSYSLDQSITHMIYMQFQRNGGNSGWTRGMVNSFVMQNGLPIYATGSGYDPEWENQGVTATLQGRDSRIRIFTKGDNCITAYNTDGTTENFAEGWLVNSSSEMRLTTGFGLKKGMVYTPNPQAHDHGVSGSIVFRATEAMLNYMEACVELNNNVDGTADNYWRALRRRALVDDNYAKTVGVTDMNQEAKWDWGAYSHGALVSPLLYNVRRERRNELSAEGHRMNDLRRWCALDQLANNPYQIEGMKFWGTVYDKSAGENPLNLKNSSGEEAVVTVDVEGGTGNMSSREISGDYVHPYQITRVNNNFFDGLRWTRAQYLSPIGQTAFRKTSTADDQSIDASVVYQNPGWSRQAGVGASSID